MIRKIWGKTRLYEELRVARFATRGVILTVVRAGEVAALAARLSHRPMRHAHGHGHGGGPVESTPGTWHTQRTRALARNGGRQAGGAAPLLLLPSAGALVLCGAVRGRAEPGRRRPAAAAVCGRWPAVGGGRM